MCVCGGGVSTVHFRVIKYGEERGIDARKSTVGEDGDLFL